MQGCLELRRRYNVPISGKRAVVLGRSNIVGMPVAHLLQVRLCSYSVPADCCCLLDRTQMLMP